MSVTVYTYYMNIRGYIDQRKFGSLGVNWSCANKSSVLIFLALIYTHSEKLNETVWRHVNIKLN